MRLSPPPDLSSDRRILLTALAVTLFACIGLIWHTGSIGKTLGDPDDAMRLVLVRELMSGKGWYDQLVMRLQPPLGSYMHWSRLLDGVLASLIWVFESVLSPAAAEWTVRFLWPMAWIFPTVLSALTMARRLGGPAAVFICAILFASNQQPFAQFIPGRVDHHNIQIALTVIAAACAMARAQRPQLAIIAGLSMAFGLAIGIEALPFHAVIGASYAMMAARARDDARTTRNFAAALAGGTIVFFCLQTPPWRWSMSFCDEIGLNLVATVLIAASGLALSTIPRVAVSPRMRIAALALTVLAAGGVYLALDPQCLHGPLATVDPRIRPFWFDLVDELKPLPIFFLQYPDMGVALIVLALTLLTSSSFLLIRQRPKPDAAVVLSSALVILAIVAGFEAFRMESYVFWLGFPLLAAGFGAAAQRLWRGVMVPTVAASVLLSPVGVAALTRVAIAATIPAPGHAAAQNAPPLCRDTAAYRPLAALPKGLVLADINMGPFILANTPHAVLTAPYHRMNWGILAAHNALSARASDAEPQFRALRIDYLVECPTDAVHPLAGSIEADLAQGRVPDWLQLLSGKGEPLQIYRVRIEGLAEPEGVPAPAHR